MKMPTTLQSGVLLRRYKRFLADVRLKSGEEVTAHCTNSGSMMGCSTPGSPVLISPQDGPKRKLKWTWELILVNDGWVGINTMVPNKLVEEAVRQGDVVPELDGYPTVKRERAYGKGSRIDLLLDCPEKGTCYVEVKNVTLAQDGVARFPDAITTRGTKHLHELMDMVAQGHRAVIFYVVQRQDCHRMEPAAEIDPVYAAALKEAVVSGVEPLCYACEIAPQAITLACRLPISIG